MNKEHLETIESEINAALYNIAEENKDKYYPFNDGVVDYDRYLVSFPKILWILKEPRDCFKPGETTSLTKDLIPRLISENRIRSTSTYRKMAYVTFSVFHKYVDYSGIPDAEEDPMVGDSLKNIAYINVKKIPSDSGSFRSDPKAIQLHYRRNRVLLNKQIATYNPDIVIAGNILCLFYEDFGFTRQDMESAGSAEFYRHNGRLYINAYHPSYPGCKEATYVNDLVTIIKKQSSVLPSSSP